MKKLGINTEQKAVIYLEHEVDYYRSKLRHMEENNRMRTDPMDVYQYMTMNIAPAEAMEVRISILDSIPKDMRDRIYSIEQTADGTASVWLDINDEKGK